METTEDMRAKRKAQLESLKDHMGTVDPADVRTYLFDAIRNFQTDMRAVLNSDGANCNRVKVNAESETIRLNFDNNVSPKKVKETLGRLFPFLEITGKVSYDTDTDEPSVVVGFNSTWTPKKDAETDETDDSN